MTTKILNDVTIQSRVDTLANWVNKNPVLANGELALVRDGNTIEIRVGDGVTNFSGLTKLSGVDIVDNLTSTSTTSALSAKQGKILNENKVSKIEGKGLSTNDYDNTAKNKVDNIPENPKYTDTVTTIVDDLTSNSSTSALSANQGRLLNENKVDKVTGKGLSTNNYDDDSKAKVDAIPLNPKYTDTIVDLTSVNQSISSLNINMNNKVDKVEGKGLSTNDYDDDAQTKVQNIPTNPKYTDTVYTHPVTAGNKHIPAGGANGKILVYGGNDGTAIWGDAPVTTTVVDSLNSDSSTSALSANKGKELNENKLNKAGGTMTGKLTSASVPPGELATRNIKIVNSTPSNANGLNIGDIIFVRA